VTTPAPYAQLLSAVQAILSTSNNISPDRIRSVISQLRALPMLAVTDEEAEELARHLEVQHDVTMTVGPVLTGRGYTPWLDATKATLDQYYWSRYRSLLEQRGFPPQVITALNSDTDRTLGLLENPRKVGPWSRRGMVVGHVQSGKTANYIGLICKAADAGY
jgi:hypothetical protein